MPVDKRMLLQERLKSGELRLEPLTLTQRELWEASPVAPGDIANHIACAIEVRGMLTPENATGALQRVVDRQEALRISILPGRERPLQAIRAKCAANFRFEDLSAAADISESVDEAVRASVKTPFDLVQGPLYRVVVLRRAPEDHLLVLAIHHAIADGWSLGVFMQELCIAYFQQLRGLNEPLNGLAQSYSAWGAAERAHWQPAALASRVSFWKSHLAGYRRTFTSLEGDATASGPHERMALHLSSEVADAAREIARKNSATLFSTLLAAFQIALSQWTGVDDILVGTPLANRTTQAVKETMGSFAGVIPIRGRVDHSLPFADAIRSVHAAAMDCFGNAIPFVELAHALGDPGAPGHYPIFEIRFALQNHPIPDVALPGLSAKLRMISTGTARFLLGCEITEDAEKLEVAWLFRPQLFAREEVEELARLFKAALNGTRPSIPIRTEALTR